MVDFRKTSVDIIELGRMVIVAAFMVVIVFMVITALLTQFIGQLSAQILGGVVSFGGLYYYAVKTKIKQKIDAWLAEQ